jgi:hypothetical protein
MYVVPKEPLPTSSEAAADEVMVPLSALGMAKTALYEACASKVWAEQNSRLGYAGISRKSIA